MITVPKIIHHSAPADKTKWHPVWFDCKDSWERHFRSPEFEHRYWNDEDLDSLVERFYPEYWDFYCEKLEFHISRIDFARFCYMDKYGGISADMDMYCFKNFYPYIQNLEVAVVETPFNDDLFGNNLMLGNGQTKFYREVLDLIVASFYPFNNRKGTRAYQINYLKDIVAPVPVTRAVCRTKCNIKILDAYHYCGWEREYREDLYAKHMLTGVWGEEVLDSFTPENGGTITDALKENYKKRNKIDLNKFNYEKKGG